MAWPKGKPKSEATKAAMSAGQYHRWHDPDRLQALAIALLERSQTERAARA